MDMEPNSVPWLKVVAASLGVTTEEAVCVITDAAMVSPRAEVLFNGGATMAAAEATSRPERHCTSGSWESGGDTEETTD